MSEKEKKKLIKSFTLIGLSFLCVLVFVKNNAIAGSWSLLPPALAIFVAFVSGRLSLSLGSAVLLGSFTIYFSNTGKIVNN